MDLKLNVWRQEGPEAKGGFKTYDVKDVSSDTSFLEMLDALNEDLIAKGEDPIAFEYDCREGICGACCLMINGVAHGPERAVTTCQTYVRSFRNGDEIYVEPWRVDAFPILKDLVVDRTSFDRIIQAGGFISVNTGSAPDGNAIPIPKIDQESAMDSAECIGCGACAAACKNASASLFVAAKVAHLARLPQGEPERAQRVMNMVTAMDREGFGSCTNQAECEAACPKKISYSNIALMNREYIRARIFGNS